MPRITQTEIARHLGISRSAVAAVLSHSPSSRISPELKERILAAAEELGYVPNRFAQIMSKGRSGLIGVIKFGGHETLPQIKAELAASRIIKEGYEPVVDNALWFADHGKAACARMIQMQVEGVVLIHPPPSFTKKHLDLLLAAKIPVVGLGCGLRGITRFLSDKEKGFYSLTRHLLDSGYRRLTLMVGRDSTERKTHVSWHAGNAIAGFRRALGELPEGDKAEGEVFTVHHQIHPPSEEGMLCGFEPGYNGMREILKRPLLPEVVLCSNDSWSLGALGACSDADVRVPEELAITGFENDPVSSYGLLPLTTVAHPVAEMAERGLGVLFECLRTGSPTPDCLTVLPGKLIVRKSCANHRRSVLSPTPSKL